MANYVNLTDDVTEEVMKKAKRELGETPETKKRALKEIRRLINDEDGFLPIMEDWFLQMFLRSKKFDVVKAFRTLKNFYKFKSTYSGTITDIGLTQLKRMLEMNAMIISPMRNINGEAVAILVVDALDTEIATPNEHFAAALAIAEIAICDQINQICGFSFVYDFKGVTLKKLMQFATPSFVSIILKCLQNTWPCRINSLHVMNQPQYFKIFYNLIKICLSKKLRDRIFIHDENIDGLYASIPRNILPKKVGGILPDNIYEDFHTYLYKNESTLETLTKYVFNGVSYGNSNADTNSSQIQLKVS